MSTNYPVDSTTRTCCGGIGTHTRDCRDPRLSDGGSRVHAMTHTITSESPAQTWRDLADDLTPKQIESMEWLESHHKNAGVLGDPRSQSLLIEQARLDVEGNRADALYADVPIPPGGAIDSAGWEKDTKGDTWSRSITWRDFDSVDAAAVSIDGRQTGDGAFTRHITLYSEDCTLTGQQARELAAVLVEAADELDRFAS